MKGLLLHIFLLSALFTTGQCENYTLSVGGGTWDSEISWEFVNGSGTIMASGGAPATVTLCLDFTCYTINMWDSFGDGWNGANWTLTNSSGSTVGFGNLGNASSGDGSTWGSTQICLTPPVPCNDTEYIITVGGGSFDSEIS